MASGDDDEPSRGGTQQQRDTATFSRIAGGDQILKWVITIVGTIIAAFGWQLLQTVNRSDARVDELASIVSRNTGKIENIDKSLSEHKGMVDKVDDRRRDDNLRNQDHFENIENRLFDLMKAQQFDKAPSK